MFELDSYLKQRAAMVEDSLTQLLPRDGVLADAMRYTTLGGGKRLRAVLFLAAAEYSGLAELKAVMPAAAALECVQAYSLIHDDLPCMDDDEMRRGKPTNHRVFGEAVALLAGDGLLTYAFELLSKLNLPAANVLAAISDLAVAIGPAGMVEGQALDCQWTGKRLSLEQMKQLHLRKTAALLCSALRCGAHLAGAQEADLAALTAYGLNFGLAFQIIDDLLDEAGDPEKMGKNAGSDARLGKTTYPVLLGAAEAKKLAVSAIADAKAALAPARSEALSGLADYVISRQS
jgi:geranylgeranyl diphosphate synthase type II